MLSRRFSPALLLAAAVALPTSAAAQTTLAQLVDSIATEAIDAGRLAGLAVGVVQGNDTLLFQGYGYADLEWNVPMTPDAIFEIGSVTKQFTSVAMLELRDEGKVDLDADITEYLPEYDTQGRAIPLRRLFDHSSGIKGYTEMPIFESITVQTLPRDSLVSLFEAEPLEFEPGTQITYNNSAYFLLGRIVEAVSGMSYEEYVEQNIFGPVGMTRSSYCTNSRIDERRAHGYSANSTGLIRAPYLNHLWPYSAGSLCSTIGDLITWNRALHGGQVLNPSSHHDLITPRPLADGTPLRYAMGITNQVVPAGHLIEHSGGINGFQAESAYYPDADLVVVALVNTSGPFSPGALARTIAEHLLGTDMAPRATPNDGDPILLTGSYRGPSRGRELTVRVSLSDDGVLSIDDGQTDREVEHLEGRTFFAGELHYTFEPSEGPATRVRLDHTYGHYVLEAFEEAAEFVVPPQVLQSYVGTYSIRPGLDVQVTLQDGRLFVQPTGQQPAPAFADAIDTFHLEVVPASMVFVTEGGEVTGMLVRQGGEESLATKIR